MVGFTEPCPCCGSGNKKQRTATAPLERTSSCPTPLTVRSSPPVPLVRSISAPIPNIFDGSTITPAETTLNRSLPPAPSPTPSVHAINPPEKSFKDSLMIPSIASPISEVCMDPVIFSPLPTPGSTPSSRSIPCPVKTPYLFSPCSADPISTAPPSRSDPVDDVNVEETNVSDLIKKLEVKVGAMEAAKKKRKEKRSKERRVKFTVTCGCSTVHEFVIIGERSHTLSRRFRERECERVRESPAGSWMGLECDI